MAHIKVQVDSENENTNRLIQHLKKQGFNFKLSEKVSKPLTITDEFKKQHFAEIMQKYTLSQIRDLLP